MLQNLLIRRAKFGIITRHLEYFQSDMWEEIWLLATDSCRGVYPEILRIDASVIDNTVLV